MPRTPLVGGFHHLPNELREKGTAKQRSCRRRTQQRPRLPKRSLHSSAIFSATTLSAAT